jgi:hypothetical protein
MLISTIGALLPNFSTTTLSPTATPFFPRTRVQLQSAFSAEKKAKNEEEEEEEKNEYFSEEQLIPLDTLYFDVVDTNVTSRPTVYEKFCFLFLDSDDTSHAKAVGEESALDLEELPQDDHIASSSSSSAAAIAAVPAPTGGLEEGEEEGEEDSSFVDALSSHNEHHDPNSSSSRCHCEREDVIECIDEAIASIEKKEEEDDGCGTSVLLPTAHYHVRL